MARIRTIKPEFWTDEKLSLLDPLTRLVFLGLVSLADDYGRLVDNVKLLDGQIFPHTDDSVLEPLVTLATLSRILRYRSKAGQQCIQIIGWDAHQRVDHKGKEVLPAPTKEDYAQPVTGQPPIKPRAKASRKSRENGARVSPAISTTLDLGPTTNDRTAVAGLGVLSKADCDTLFSAWGKAFGAYDYGRFRKEFLKAFQPGQPQYTIPEIVNGIVAAREWWIEQDDRDQSFFTLEKFIQQLGSKWIAFGRMPLSQGGEITERGAWAGSRAMREQARRRAS